MGKIKLEYIVILQQDKKCWEKVRKLYKTEFNNMFQAP